MTPERRTSRLSRRHFALALPSALLASGCAAPHRGTGRPGDPIVLTLLSHYANGVLKQALQGPVDEWNATHDRVKVQTKAVEFTDLLTTVMVRQAAGLGADILHPYCLWNGQLVQAGVLRPAPPGHAGEITRGYGEAAVDAASVGGRVYGYPTEVQTYALYYNKRLLREAGVDGPRAPGGSWRRPPTAPPDATGTATPWSRGSDCRPRTTPPPSARHSPCSTPPAAGSSPRTAGAPPSTRRPDGPCSIWSTASS
ncbi:hypothetical protein GCM10020295_03430 [Streptomyces cinereospinus]